MQGSRTAAFRFPRIFRFAIEPVFGILSLFLLSTFFSFFTLFAAVAHDSLYVPV
jgi:hypothetical protein